VESLIWLDGEALSGSFHHPSQTKAMHKNTTKYNNTFLCNLFLNDDIQWVGEGQQVALTTRKFEKKMQS
jgi:hypothetical protein